MEKKIHKTKGVQFILLSTPDTILHPHVKTGATLAHVYRQLLADVYVCFRLYEVKYRKSLKETRRSYFFIVASNAGLIQGRVSFKGGSY